MNNCEWKKKDFLNFETEYSVCVWWADRGAEGAVVRAPGDWVFNL